MSARGAAVAALLCVLAPITAARPVRAQPPQEAEKLVQLDFKDAEIADVIETIARMTGKNFIYDDRVRGRVTIISPTRIPVDQAYAVFESVLQVKGFTTVETPGGALKVIPVRDAKESSVETVETDSPPVNRDRFVTRLIPLRYVEAEPIVNTLKPLVSKDAAIAAYAPTNTVILTESASNIRRIHAILESIDVDTYAEELAVIKVEYADATTLAEQLTEIFSDESEATTPRRGRARRRPAAQAATSVTGEKPGGVRILTDERTNSLIVLAARGEIDEVRNLVARLDVPVLGGGRIHVHYLQHADAEELSETLTSLISGRSAPAAGGGAAGGEGGGAQALRAAVSALAGGVSVTADPPTNSLVIQASKEGYETILSVIEKLDVERPQVLVEALIMEVDVTDSEDLGFNGIYRLVTDDLQLTVETLTDAATRGVISGMTGLGPLGALIEDPGTDFLGGFRTSNQQGSSIEGLIRAAAGLSGINIISAPHILTSDNEEAEIRIGDNIPIISSRVQSAAGQEVGLSTSVNVERQDIGVTLRVTPQITEGDSLRLDIFQELTAVNPSLSFITGSPEQVGVALSNRRIENTVVVSDKDTVVVGGLISDRYEDSVSKIPWLGDIPVLGWAFKTTTRSLQKVNLLVFLTPHIVRAPTDLEYETIRKREEFRGKTLEQLSLSNAEREEEARRLAQAEAQGLPYKPARSRNAVRTEMLKHNARYPVERMAEIEKLRAEERAERRSQEDRKQPYYVVQVPVAGDEMSATSLLMELIDAGYDGTLVSTEVGGTVLFEIRLGPYETLDEAQQAGKVVQRSHGLAPAVMIVDPEAP